jgi:hypothetical protein
MKQKGLHGGWSAEARAYAAGIGKLMCLAQQESGRHAVHDHEFGDFPAKKTVCQRTLSSCHNDTRDFNVALCIAILM